MRQMRNTYTFFVRKPEGKRQLVRPKCRWEGNIERGHKEIGCESMDWIHLAQARDQCWVLVNTNEPLGFIKGNEFLDWLSDC
jgi:hypothetical protein